MEAFMSFSILTWKKVRKRLPRRKPGESTRLLGYESLSSLLMRLYATQSNLLVMWAKKHAFSYASSRPPMCGYSSSRRRSSTVTVLVGFPVQTLRCFFIQRSASSCVRTEAASMMDSIMTDSKIWSWSSPRIMRTMTSSWRTPRARKRMKRGISVFMRGMVARRYMIC